MDKTRDKPGVLYIVATPIGNLDDISRRALQVLEAVTLVAAEDTRHSRKLLAHYGIEARLFALHEHNEPFAAEKLLKMLLAGDEGRAPGRHPGGSATRAECLYCRPVRCRPANRPLRVRGISAATFGGAQPTPV